MQGGTGGLSSSGTSSIGPKLRAVFPQAVAAPNTLATGLNNANAILHVANMVGNIGRLESVSNGYRFYAEGYTPSAIRVLERVSAERLAESLGLVGKSVEQIRRRQRATGTGRPRV